MISIIRTVDGEDGFDFVLSYNFYEIHCKSVFLVLQVCDRISLVYKFDLLFYGGWNYLK